MELKSKPVDFEVVHTWLYICEQKEVVIVRVEFIETDVPLTR